MKKLIQKIIIGSLVSSISLCSPTSITFANTINSLNSAENLEQKKPSWTTVLKGIKWIVVKIDGSLYYRDPISSSTSTSVQTSSGTVKFGKEAQRTKFVFNVDSSKNLHLWGQTNFTNWLGKINIFVEDSSGNQVAGKYVTHNQHLLTSVPAGKYSCYYVGESGDTWDSWLFVGDNSKQLNTSNYIFNSETNRMYLIPSAEHTSHVYYNTINEVNATTLDNEFFDDDLGVSVNMTKHFKTGTNIIFKDNIDSIEYIPSENKTIFGFNTNKGETLTWPFSGDLTNEFNINDELTLKLKIVDEFSANGYTFQNLDYILETYDGMDTNTYPDIHKYLIQN